ncbi:S41 family peptidase [Bacteroidota bacterium]
MNYICASSKVMVNPSNKWQPLIYAVLLATGISVGMLLRPSSNAGIQLGAAEGKLNELIKIINQSYVDSVDFKDLEQKTIDEMLAKLDPHSVYIPAEDLKQANEQLEGNFEGIGVEFNIINDTIMVVAALNGGPAQELGILPGDRIIQVDSIKVAGTGITTDRVFKLLRGKGGTEVKVIIYRPANRSKQEYTIVRGTIPIFSVDASFMLDSKTGYIKISRFAEKTHDEFLEAFGKLEKAGLENLVLDLRGNPGGYLTTATRLLDELLADKKLMVYTQGLNKARADYFTERRGVFEKGKLAVLIDEGSASASEILSGAVQDWDRGIIVGRRSFGKGLVQEPFELNDGSVVRLTVARYYTPSERCIQKSYKNLADYEHDILTRFENGELEDEHKEAIFDSTPYFTKEKGRVVYGGGGIYPDVFVPLDTTFSTRFLTEAVSKALLGKFAYDYLDKNRERIKKLGELENYIRGFALSDADYQQFVSVAIAQGCKAPSADENKRSSAFIRLQIKALIARQIWRDNGYYQVMQSQDRGLKAALEALNKEK